MGSPPSASDDSPAQRQTRQTTARLVGRVTPTKTSAIVGTYEGKFSDSRLNQLPDKGRVVWTSFHDDRATSHACLSLPGNQNIHLEKDSQIVFRIANP